MEHTIKKTLKEESLKGSLKERVKDYGWKVTAEMVNGPEVLAKLAFNNDPMEFLHMFDDMDVVQSETNPNQTLFRYENVYNLMIYNKKSGSVYLSYYDIWLFLEDGFGLNYSETQELTTRWVGESYNLRGVTTWKRALTNKSKVGESYNLRGVTTSCT